MAGADRGGAAPPSVTGERDYRAWSSSGDGGKGLSPSQEEEAHDRSNPAAIVVHEAIRREGEEELLRSPVSIGWSGLAAGLAMGFSLAAEGIIRAGTNIVGAGLFAWMAHSAIFDASARESFLALGIDAASGSFWVHFGKAVVAGWLIALIVWLLPAAASAHFLVIFSLSYLVGVASLSHVIAGSVEVLFAVIGGAVTPAEYVFRFFVPVFLGNAIGGVVLVALLNHAQTRREL